MGRDFDRADRVREELKAIGIEVSDQDKTWTAGGADPAATGCVPLSRAPAPVLAVLRCCRAAHPPATFGPSCGWQGVPVRCSTRV